MKNQSFLSTIEFLVLMSALNFHGKAYGVPIHDEIYEKTSKDLAFGVIYKALKKLRDKGYLRQLKGEPTKERGGRAITYYEVTALGNEILGEHHKYLDAMRVRNSKTHPEEVFA